MSRTRWGLVVVLVLLGTLALTWGVLLTGPAGTWVGRFDVPRYFVPQAHLLDVALHRGSFPTWNPYTFAGAPYAANPQSGALFAPNIVRALLAFGATTRTTAFTLVAMWGVLLVISGAGAYRFARASGSSRYASLGASIVFMCSALMVRRCGEMHFLPSLFVLPWLLVHVRGMLRAHDGRRATRDALWGALWLALGVTGGFLQVIIYVAVGVFAYALAVRVVEGRGTRVVRLRRDVVLATVFAIVTAGASACLLLPLQELGGLVARQPGDDIPQFSDLTRLDATTLWKSFLLFAGPSYAAEGARLAGLTTCILALAAVVGPRARRAIAPAVAFAVLLDAAFGPTHPVGRIVQALAPFSLSAPPRALDVAMVFLAVLTAQGIDAVGATRTRRARVFRGLIVVTVGLALIGAAVQLCAPSVFLPIGADAFAWPVAALVVVATAAFAGRSRVTRLALVACLFFETFAWNRHYVPFLLRNENMKDQVFSSTAPAPFPRDNRRDGDRTAMRAQNALVPAMNGYDPVHLKLSRDVVSGPPRDATYHRLVTDAEPNFYSQRGNLLLKRRAWLVDTVVVGALPDKQALFPAAHTAFVDPGVDRARSLAGIAVVPASTLPATSLGPRRSALATTPASPLPVDAQRGRDVVFTFTVDSTVPGVPPASRRRHAAMFLRVEGDAALVVEPRVRDLAIRGRNGYAHRTRIAGGIEPRVVEIPLPDVARAEVSLTLKQEGPGTARLTEVTAFADDDDEDHLVSVAQLDPDVLRVTTGPLPAPRLLVLVESRHPGFIAHVDGAPADLLPVDDAFQGVLLGPGKHVVTLTFSSRRLHIGVAISLLTLALVGAWLIRLRRAPSSSISNTTSNPTTVQSAPQQA